MHASEQREGARLFGRVGQLPAAHDVRSCQLVSAGYVHRWAEAGRLRVTDVQARRTFDSTSGDVGLGTDCYRLYAEGLDHHELVPLPLHVLTAETEGRAQGGLTDLVEVGWSSAEHLERVAFYLALRMTQGRAFLATLRSAVKEAADGPRSQSHARTHLRTPHDVVLTDLAARAAAGIVPYLLTDRHWLTYDTPDLLVTCDEPVVSLGGPLRERAEQGDLDTAPVILFPLSPSKLLVLLRSDLRPEERRELDTLEVADINRELVASSTRWVFERPSRRVGMRIRVPGPPPVLMTQQSGTHPADDGAWHRLIRPTRWVCAPQTPWPVSRWWDRWY